MRWLILPALLVGGTGSADNEDNGWDTAGEDTAGAEDDTGTTTDDTDDTQDTDDTDDTQDTDTDDEPSEAVAIGSTASLIEHAHDVGGTATLVDAQTIEITGFSYDGEGIDARFFLVQDGAAFDTTNEISGNLVGTGPYRDDTLTLTIPTTVDPTSWDAITLWCIPFGASFGSGVFASGS